MSKEKNKKPKEFDDPGMVTQEWLAELISQVQGIADQLQSIHDDMKANEMPSFYRASDRWKRGLEAFSGYISGLRIAFNNSLQNRITERLKRVPKAAESRSAYERGKGESEHK